MRKILHIFIYAKKGWGKIQTFDLLPMWIKEIKLCVQELIPYTSTIISCCCETKTKILQKTSDILLVVYVWAVCIIFFIGTGFRRLSYTLKMSPCKVDIKACILV